MRISALALLAATLLSACAGDATAPADRFENAVVPEGAADHAGGWLTNTGRQGGLSMRAL